MDLKKIQQERIKALIAGDYDKIRELNKQIHGTDKET